MAAGWTVIAAANNRLLSFVNIAAALLQTARTTVEGNSNLHSPTFL